MIEATINENPAKKEAKKILKSIPKNGFSELYAMIAPPQGVKDIIEEILKIMGSEVTKDWA